MPKKRSTPSPSGASPKIFLDGGRAFHELYTKGLLESLCELYGVTQVPEEQAEALFFSCCDPDDIKWLERLRLRAGGRPIIMGGFEGYFGVPYLAWADAVVVGEGLEFFRVWGRDPEAALALPCVLTKEKLRNKTTVRKSVARKRREREEATVAA
jgi:hypothetical protein